MRAEELFAAIGEAPEGELTRALAGKKRGPRWVKWAAAGAAACLAVGLGVGLVTGRLPVPLGANAGGGGRDGRSYMSYAGPAFPLTVQGENPGLTARRHIDFDFAPYETREKSYEDRGETHAYTYHEEKARITDRYTLTNPTGEEAAVTLLYPFSGNYSNATENAPVLTVDGAEVEAELHPGPYTGGFAPAWGSRDTTETVNLDQPSSWEDYRALLATDDYQKSAFDDYPDFSGTTVTVYKLTEAWGPERDEKAGIPNPSIRVFMELDYEKTTVLTYGFHGANYDAKGGKMTQSFSIREEGTARYGQPYYIIAVGEDLTDLTTGCYVTGGTEGTTRSCEGGVTVERYEADLEDILREIAGLWMGEPGITGNAARAGFEDWYGLFKEWLVTYGPLSESGVQRYGSWLGDNDVSGADRVTYAAFEVTVPAGGSVEVTVTLTKEASRDFVGKNKDRNGYDMTTTLGSDLLFAGQTASITNSRYIEIVDQNFGFDPENGVTEVELDLNEPHYWMDVRARE